MTALLKVVAVMLSLAALGACSGLSRSGQEAASVDGALAPVPQKAQARFDDGLRAMEAQHWYEALPTMEIVWQEYPQYSGPALNAALIHQQEGRPKQAETWFMRALQANGENLEARNGYGIFLREQGRYREAEEQYLAALAIADGHAVTHYNMGILYDLYLGEKAAALDHFSRYLELNQEQNRQVAGWIADLQRQLAQTDTGQGGAT